MQTIYYVALISGIAGAGLPAAPKRKSQWTTPRVLRISKIMFLDWKSGLMNLRSRPLPASYASRSGRSVIT